MVPCVLLGLTSFFVSGRLLSALPAFFQSFCHILLSFTLAGFMLFSYLLWDYFVFEFLSGSFLVFSTLQGFSVLWNSQTLHFFSLDSPKLLWLPFRLLFCSFLSTEVTLECFQSFCCSPPGLFCPPAPANFLNLNWGFWVCFSLSLRYVASQQLPFLLLGFFQPPCLILPFSRAIICCSFNLSFS